MLLNICNMAKKKKKASRLEAFYKVHGKYFVNPIIIMIPKASLRIARSPSLTSSSETSDKF